MYRSASPEWTKFNGELFLVNSQSNKAKAIDIKTANPRQLALQSLLLVIGKGRSLDDALSSVLEPLPGLDARDIGLSRELASGVCRWYYSLQFLLKPRLRKAFKSKDLDLHIILLIGMYQIMMMRVDDHAAVNETVKLAQLQNKGWARGLVNGVLRQLIRDEAQIESIPVEESYPQWMQNSFAADWPEQCVEILHAGNQRAPMTLRVDLNQRARDEQIELMREQSIEASAHPVVESAVVLDKPCPVAQIDGFEAGMVSVQDAATQLAAQLLDCRPGMRVLDACAAPGGKSAHILQACDELTLLAVDKDESRLALIEQNLGRIGRQAQLLCGDAAQPADWHDGEQFDRILADVPCTASGVIRRHPDIKLLRRDDDISKLVLQQQAILRALWPLLKPGGVMVYSTCSIFKDENEHQIASFVSDNKNCTVNRLNSVQWGEKRPYGRQILPGQQDMDGFYYAKLHKTLTMGASIT
ncbi:MAG: 16S rRNA (cytosine967-C5)-methyltransferase [Gammaproteobacteria bacterium]|jgi:16S rRNA (cytosine967-C5)-methyltransferase